MRTFEQALAPQISALWQAKGFPGPSPIQAQLYEPLYQGQSLVAISPTGSGKTLAYLLPVLARLEPGAGLQALILAPSQELAKQIASVAQEWGQALDLTTQLVVGGANFKRQQEALKAKPNVIVATPGRFLELMNQTRKLKLHQVRYLILDEADYLLGDEHEGTLYRIRKALMRDTTLAWVSATYEGALQNLVAEGTPLYRVESETASEAVDHLYLLSHDRQKLQQLRRLAQVEGMQALVFFEQVHELESIAAKLAYQGIAVAVMHGKLSKQERELAFRQVKQGRVTYLLTTDMAARGLDIPDLPYILHYNRVETLSTYIHRSGRTGRMGKRGTVISLVNEQELRDLMRLLAESHYDLTEAVVFRGQLMSASEKEAQRQEVRPDVEELSSGARVSRKGGRGPRTQNKPSASPQRKTAKKKVRQRDSKNKGKRKTK